MCLFFGMACKSLFQFYIRRQIQIYGGITMRCPICNGEMEKGYVQFHRGLAWVKNKHKISLAPKKDELFIYNIDYQIYKYLYLKYYTKYMCLLQIIYHVLICCY